MVLADQTILESVMYGPDPGEPAPMSHQPLAKEADERLWARWSD